MASTTTKRSMIETLAYLDHFRNIDLHQQGYYYLRLQLFQESSVSPHQTMVRSLSVETSSACGHALM